ncbi:hypothetical protein AB1Y20_007453 [Prymnesium parvum]|uniref:Prolyl 4-hydroxylase alpha subunit domain-containing protein n=1 Tax=Prymnesium parvum TaxID=97485 RepID=A0AB34IYN4_PRYPA
MAHASLAARASGRVLSRQPAVRVFDHLLTPAECARLRRLAAGHMAACEVRDSPRLRHRRSSTGCWLPRSDAAASAWRTLRPDPPDAALLAAIEAWVAAACGLPRGHGEPAQVLRYRAGELYALHPDFFDARDADELANGGQRRFTCLVYLSTVPHGAGGATHFPFAAESGERGLRIQPVAGRAVLFENCRRDGRVEPRSVHAGETVKRRVDPSTGNLVEKWVLTKWMREANFEVREDAGFGSVW